MTQHYRHHRVANRSKQYDMPSYTESCMKTLCDAFTVHPILVFGLSFLLFIMLLKCLLCHK